MSSFNCALTSFECWECKWWNETLSSWIYFFDTFCTYYILPIYAIAQDMPHAIPKTQSPFYLYRLRPQPGTSSPKEMGVLSWSEKFKTVASATGGGHGKKGRNSGQKLLFNTSKDDKGGFKIPQTHLSRRQNSTTSRFRCIFKLWRMQWLCLRGAFAVSWSSKKVNNFTLSGWWATGAFVFANGWPKVP